MALVRQIVQDALTEIGAYSTGESLAAADAALALRRLTMQIDAWNAERLTIAVNRRVVFTLPGGTAEVTIGTDGTADVAAPRPTFFTGLNYIVPGSSPEVEVAMGQMDDDQYAALSIKDLTSSLPTEWHYSATTPNGTLGVWPVPSADVELVLYYPQPLTAPTTLQDELIGPPGYEEAFMYQLALRLATPFGRPLPPALPEMAAHALARMKRPNTQPGLLAVDAALVPDVTGAYNILSDQSS